MPCCARGLGAALCAGRAHIFGTAHRRRAEALDTGLARAQVAPCHALLREGARRSIVRKESAHLRDGTPKERTTW